MSRPSPAVMVRPAAGRPAAVEARGWGWRHPGRRGWAVRNLDLTIAAGERVLLLGPSGAGKSTLLGGLAGLLDPAGGGEQEGSLLVDGRPPWQARGRAGLLFQDPETQLIMARAGDDVAFGLENRCVPTPAIWPRVAAALEAVGWRYPSDHPTAALSGGEQQRLALAGTLALAPGLLLLDEPTANLDPEGAESLRDVLAQVLSRLGTTLLLVEHRVADALPLVERVVILSGTDGIVADGGAREVFATHGTRLQELGVWIPSGPPARRRARLPSSGGALLLADQVTFRYPRTNRPAVSRVELAVRAGEACALVGRNGSGKTTLALLLAGLLRPSSGAVVSGETLTPGHGREPIWRWPPKVLVRRIGMVFQEPEHQFLCPTVREELELGPRRVGLAPDVVRRRTHELLERLHLAQLAAANPFTLSGGEKRRLSVATALATAPPILILDEPTFGQDRRTWTELLDLLAGLRDAGRAVVVATHDVDFATALADRIVRLDGGVLAGASSLSPR